MYGITTTFKVESLYDLTAEAASGATDTEMANMLLGITQTLRDGKSIYSAEHIGAAIRAYFGFEGAGLIKTLEEIIAGYNGEDESG